MATLTPGGSASVGGGNTPLSFPLLPQGWPLTVIPGSRFRERRKFATESESREHGASGIRETSVD